MTPFEATLRRAVADLDALGVPWAMIGGVAVSARSVPRFTKDVDFAIAVADDASAEALIHRLGGMGHTPREFVEHEYLARLSTVRLAHSATDVVIDLLFASSGIEKEIVDAATLLEVLPTLRVPVAAVGHLIALKVLAGRHQDLTDLEALLPTATTADLSVARAAVELIVARGFSRGQDLVAELDRAIESSPA